MEGRIYEVNVHTLEPTRLFAKPVPGGHGKGAYTGQGRYIVANNGESGVGGHSLKDLQVGGPPQGPEDNGVLAERDGSQWRIIQRRQFTDVTGPGGIDGAPDDDAPVWAIGWDRRSVLLMLLDQGTWHTFRMPKASRVEDLATWGPRTAWGGPWVNDPVKAGEPSAPFLINGFDRRCRRGAFGSRWRLWTRSRRHPSGSRTRHGWTTAFPHQWIGLISVRPNCASSTGRAASARAVRGLRGGISMIYCAVSPNEPIRVPASSVLFLHAGERYAEKNGLWVSS